MGKSSKKRVKPLSLTNFLKYFETSLGYEKGFTGGGNYKSFHPILNQGLTGGGSGKIWQDSNMQGLETVLDMELQLENLNNCNACYVNSSLQVFFMTEYAQFILNKKTFTQHQRVSKALFDIFSGKETSVKKLRQIISIDSGKFYYDNNSQQDSAEFLGDLEDLLSKELESEDFREVQNCHWGSEKLTRKFFESSEGNCKHGCKPFFRNQNFLILRLRMSLGESKVTLQNLVDQHFAPNYDIEELKCSVCCQNSHLEEVKCTLSGRCEKKSAFETCELTCQPKYLLSQLIRWDENGRKLKTFVQVDEDLIISETCKYKAIAILSHLGESKNSGHYITHRKTINNQWLRCDDSQITNSTLVEANSKSNYIILCERVENVIPHEGVYDEMVMTQTSGLREQKNSEVLIEPNFMVINEWLDENCNIFQGEVKKCYATNPDLQSLFERVKTPGTCLPTHVQEAYFFSCTDDAIIFEKYWRHERHMKHISVIQFNDENHIIERLKVEAKGHEETDQQNTYEDNLEYQIFEDEFYGNYTNTESTIKEQGSFDKDGVKEAKQDIFSENSYQAISLKCRGCSRTFSSFGFLKNHLRKTKCKDLFTESEVFQIDENCKVKRKQSMAKAKGKQRENLEFRENEKSSIAKKRENLEFR